MTVKQAIQKLLESDNFNEDARTDARLRVFRQRFNAGQIKNGAAINLLQLYGYKIEITESKKVKN